MPTAAGQQRRGGKVHMDVAHGLHCQCWALLGLEKDAEALPLAQRVLAIARKIEAFAADLCKFHNVLGGVQLRRGDEAL